jgi:hypothetical protein
MKEEDAGEARGAITSAICEPWAARPCTGT